MPCPVLHTTVAFHSSPATDDGEIGDNGDDTSDTLVTNGSECADLFKYHNRIVSTRNDTDTGNDPALPTTTPKFQLDYEVDGAVYKLTSFPFRATLGSSARAPRWAIAHKFPPWLAATRLLGINVQMGRMESLTPVVVLEPAELGGGVTVSRASLFNFAQAREVLGVDGDGDREGEEGLMGGALVVTVPLQQGTAAAHRSQQYARQSTDASSRTAPHRTARHRTAPN